MSILMVAVLLPYNSLALELTEDLEDTEEVREEIFEETEETPEEYEASEPVYAENQIFGATSVSSGSCGAEGDNVKWNFDSDGVLTISGTGAMKDYTSYNSKPWHSLNVTSLVIKSGVTRIGNYCFYGKSNIKGSLSLPSTLTSIGDYAFYDCSGFTGKLHIPSSVTSIGKEAFRKCSGFTGDLVIPGGVTEILGYTFCNCTGFTGKITMGEVTSIGNYAFWKCSGITNDLTFPESLKNIGESAFYGSGIKNYYFTGNAVTATSATVASPKYPSFPTASTVYYPEEDTTWTSAVSDGKWKGYAAEAYNPKYLGAIAYGYCGADPDGKNVEWSLNSDGTLVLTGTGAMADYTSYIGMPWYNYRESVKSVVIEEGVTNIGSYSFINHHYIAEISIASTVTKIGEHAFEGLEELTGDLVIPDTVKSIGDYAFSGILNNNLGKIVIGDGVETIGNFAFYTSMFTGLELGNSVKSIGMQAFAYANEISGELVLPESLVEIGDSAFENTGFSGDVMVPESVLTIGSMAFKNCGVDNYYFKSDAPSVYPGKYVFGSFDVSSDTIYYPHGNDTWVIEDGKWNGYAAKTWYSDAVSSGYCGADPDGKNVEWYIDQSGTLFIIGTGAMKDYTYLSDVPWSNNSNIKKVVMSEGITHIGEMAFAYCDAAAKTIVLPQSLESIGREAFLSCDTTRDVLVIPENVTKIGIKAFYSCGINTYLFEGIEPRLVYEESSSGQSFDSDDYIYFNGIKDDWALDSNGKWEGYNVFPYCGYCGNETENHGENVEWVFDFETGKLTVSGTGRIKSFNTKYVSHSIGYITDAPWSNFMDKLKTLEIEEGITEIGYEAFRGCSGFTGELKIPESVVKIYGGAFNNCSGFTGDIIIPNNVTWIGGDAFYNCSGFNGKLYLGESLERISDAAFSGCTNLTGTVTIPGTVTLIGNSFENCSINEYYFSSNPPKVNSSSETNPSFDAASDTIYYPFDNREWVITGGKWNGYRAVGWKNDLVDFGYCGAAGNEENLKWALKKDGTLTIWGTGAMANYYYESVNAVQRSTAPWAKYPEYLKTLVLEEGMTSIGEFAFYKCGGFTGDIVIPKGVTTIGKTSFFECTGFNGTLTIPDTVATIGESVFMNCTGLTGNIVIPDSVKTLGFQSFKGCTGFDGTLSIGKGLCVIQNSVFFGCTGLTGDLILSENITDISTWAFKNCGIDNFYFKGDAPAVHAASAYNPTFDAASDTIYYIVERDNWNVEDGLWNGYKAVGANLGDVYSDGEVNVMDASYVRRMIVKLVEPTSWQRVLADVNADGKVNVVDANLIRKFAADIITSFPI